MGIVVYISYYLADVACLRIRLQKKALCTIVPVSGCVQINGFHSLHILVSLRRVPGAR